MTETLVAVVIGALLAFAIQGLGQRQSLTLQARLVLIDTYRLLYADNEWVALLGQLNRLRTYLELAKVPADTIRGLEEAAKACWRDSRIHAEDHYDPEMGHVISTGLLDEYRRLERETMDHLGKRWVLRRS